MTIWSGIRNVANAASSTFERTRTSRTRTPSRKTLLLEMRILELFSGSGSLGKAARERGHDVVSLDIAPCGDYTPDFLADILEFDYTIWHRGFFDLVWASIPCEKFSIAPARGFTAEERQARAEEGCVIARKTRAIIDHLQPRFTVIENPASSSLWKQGIFDDLSRKTVSYCMYSDWGYRKNTCIATDVDFVPKRCKGDCGYVRTIIDLEGKAHRWHTSVAKQGVSAHTRGLGVQDHTHKRNELWRIPPKLLEDILEAAERMH